MRLKREYRSCQLGTASSWLVVPVILGLVACTEPKYETSEFVPFAEAVLRFEQPDSSPLHPFGPIDLKAESPDAAWIADPQLGAVLRLEPPMHDYRQMGLQDEPPGEVDRPAKLAVAKNIGLFTYDVASKEIHLFTPEGMHIRAFEPRFTPATFEISREPIGLVFGQVDRSDPEVPRLVVIRTDTRGMNPDTLLASGSHGPSSLWKAVASSGELTLDASESGLWASARAVPDTVYDITDRPGARKRVLRPEDQSSKGVLADIERQILWVVRDGEKAGELRYAAYDTREPGTVGPDRAFLGERVTYEDFIPWHAIDGTVMGFSRSTRGLRNLASYDMRVPPTLP